MSDETNEAPSSLGSLSYRGSVSGLKGLLTDKIGKTIASAVTQISERSKTVQSTHPISMDEIYPCPDQPRQVFEPKSLEELAETMKEVGQAQAITVRKTERGYEIISGERRYRAARLAGLTHLDCLVKEVDSKEARLLSLVENVQRKDLLPIEEAHYLKKVLQENPSLSLEKMAKMLGSHKSTLSEKIQLTEVPDDMQKLLYSKGQGFTHRHWRVVSRISDPEHLRHTMLEALNQRLSVMELERSLEAAGIKKARRRPGAKTKSSSQLGFEGLEVVKRIGDTLRFKKVTVDLKMINYEVKEKLITELEEILATLKKG